jgi:hypothetical protein
MFHYKENNIITNADRQLISTTFKKYSTSTKDKRVVNKTDLKASWLYLFGYKPSKASKKLTHQLIIMKKSPYII